MKKETERKIKFCHEFECPHCGFMVHVEAGKNIIKPAVKGESEEFVEVTKSKQSTLETEPNTPKK